MDRQSFDSTFGSHQKGLRGRLIGKIAFALFRETRSFTEFRSSAVMVFALQQPEMSRGMGSRKAPCTACQH